MTKVAVLGVGRMGYELGVQLLRAGHDVTVWNRTASGAERIVRDGAAYATSPQGAVDGADVIITVLFGPAAVREVVLDGLTVAPSAVWLDVTTVSPADAQEFQDWAVARGVRYVHGPVVGSLGPARAGSLGVLLGGEPADLDVVAPLVSLWADSERLRRVETPQVAATGKLLANLALGVSLQGLVEALRLGKANGLDASTVLAMLDRTGLGFIANMKTAMLESQEFSDTQFSVDLLAKDSRLMIASTPEPLPAVTALLQSLVTAQRTGAGDSDIAVVTSPELVADEPLRRVPTLI